MTHHDRDDESLRSAFAELRAADQRSAPAFEDVVARRVAAQPIGGAPAVRRLAIAAGLVLATGLAYRAIAARAGRLTVPTEVIALSAWRPATDVLLETPGRSLLKHAPRLGASMIDITPPGELR
jgi:hypothetical protein